MPTVTPAASPHETHAAPNRTNECPRCGYDLRGAIASWQHSCPMQGRCAECGLEFEWSWLFRSQVHPWLFEHQWRRRPILSTALTLPSALLGRSICRQISLAHPIRLAPLLTLLVTLRCSTLAIRTAGAAYAATQLFAGRLGAGRWWGLSPGRLTAMQTERDLALFAVHVAPALLLPPIVFLTIPSSLQKLKVRPRHIVRVGLYWLIAIATFMLILALVQTGWSLLAGSEVPRDLRPGAWQFVRWSPATRWWVQIFNETVLPIWVATVALAWLWWRWACRDYLRLPDATLTATLLMIIVVLASYLVQHAVSVFTHLL